MSPMSPMSLLKNQRLRRTIGVTLMLAGGLLLWLAPETGAGVALLVAGIALEFGGIWLEHRQGPR